MTATSVTLGFEWEDDSSGTGGTDPSGKISLGDQVAQAKATVKWINLHGGVAHRTLDLVTYGENYLNTFNDSAGEDEKACAAFTQDRKVLAASLYFPDTTLVNCLAKHNVVSLSDIYVFGKSLYDRDPFFAPGQMTYERGHIGAALALAGRGFFAGAKVGIFYDEDPTFAPVLSALKSALTAHGIDVVAEYGSHLASAQQGAQDASSAVLQFRSKGVSHVMFVDLGGGLSYLFMNAAQSQAYTPKYALSTANGLLDLEQLAPSTQLANAAALGWTPGEADSERARVQQGWNATGKTCYRIMTGAGIDMSNDITAASAILICDQLLGLKAAIDHASVLTPAGILQSVGQLGTTFQSASAFSTRLGPGRPDGAVGTRFLKWGSCSCWVADGTGPNL